MGTFSRNVSFWWFVPQGEGGGCWSERGMEWPPRPAGSRGVSCALSRFRCPEHPGALSAASPAGLGGAEGHWVGLGAADHGLCPPGTMGTTPTRGESVDSQSSPLPGIPAFATASLLLLLVLSPSSLCPPSLLSLKSAWEKKNPAVN